MTIYADDFSSSEPDKWKAFGGAWQTVVGDIRPCKMWLMRILTSAMFALLLSGVMPSTAIARTATAAERAACEAKIQRKIDQIDARMRSKYSAREGERLREQRRQFEADRANCRKVQ
jgi:hypothetical protein